MTDLTLEEIDRYQFTPTHWPELRMKVCAAAREWVEIKSNMMTAKECDCGYVRDLQTKAESAVDQALDDYERDYYRDMWLAQRAENEIFRKQLGLVPVSDEAAEEIHNLRETLVWEKQQTELARAETERLNELLLDSDLGNKYEALRTSNEDLRDEIKRRTESGRRCGARCGDLIRENEALRARLQKKLMWP